jgi:hypothetical protein
MNYLQQYAIDTAYIAPQHETEARGTYKRRIYATMALLLRENPVLPQMRAMALWPGTDWDTVWENLRETPATENVKMDWYTVINDIHTTNERLHKIRISPTDQCNQSEAVDTL